MDYLNIFGEYKEQLISFEKLSDELFFRKIIILANLSHELSKHNTHIFLNIDPEMKRVSFFVQNDNFPKKQNNSIYGILLDLDTFEISTDFISEHNTSLNVLFDIEHLFVYRQKYQKKTKIEITKDSTNWISDIFYFTEKEQILPIFSQMILNNQLSNKNNINLINKI